MIVSLNIETCHHDRYVERRFILVMVLTHMNILFCVLFRIHLAGLHYNENSDREQATTSTGAKRYKVSKLKYKDGIATIKEVKEDATYCK